MTDHYIPHAACLANNPTLIALHLIADGLVASAYFVIPVTIVLFIIQNLSTLLKDLQDMAYGMRSDEAMLQMKHKMSYYRTPVLMTAAFVFCCGVTHVMKIIVLYRPLYWGQGIVDLITGLVSWGAVASFLITSRQVRKSV